MLVARLASGRVAKCIFNLVEADLAKIQPKNHQNVQKMHFLQKAPGVNGLTVNLLKDLPKWIHNLFSRPYV